MNKKLVLGLAVISLMLFTATTQSTQAANYKQVGVTVGATALYSLSGSIGGFNGTRIHIDITNITGAIVTIRYNDTYSASGNISTMSGITSLAFMVIAAGLNSGESISSDSTTYTLTSQGSGSAGGATRTLNYYSISSPMIGSMEMKWDKATGLLAGWSVQVSGGLIGGISGGMTLLSTSLWNATGGGILDLFTNPLVLGGVVAIVVVVVVAAVVLVRRRK